MSERFRQIDVCSKTVQVPEAMESRYRFIIDPEDPKHEGFWRGIPTGSVNYPEDSGWDLGEALDFLSTLSESGE